MPSTLGNFGNTGPEVAKTTDYTVTAADNGTLFTTTGASGTVNFTLPAPAAGLSFTFFNTVDQTMAILSASSADNIITDGDAGADSITFSTSSHKIGACVRVVCNAAGTAWYSQILCQNAATIA